MRCPRCNSEMKNIMHFENGKNFAFHECSKCYMRTHPKRIHFEEKNNENTGNTKRI